MVDTLGLPTILFNHSAADLQRPNLALLICFEDPACISAVIDNPAVADWFCHNHIQKFVDAFYVGVLGPTDCWLQYEWQHRGSPHVHGLAWLADAPNVEQVLASSSDNSSRAQQEFFKYVDQIISTINPAILLDGRNAVDALSPQNDPHICSKQFSEVDNIDQDLSHLVATCQRHTCCSAAHCLQTHEG